MKLQTEIQAEYKVEIDDEQFIIERAIRILEARLRTGTLLDSSKIVKNFLALKNASHDENGQEVFSVLFLDAQLRVIDYSVMFRGTLTQTSVYPREIVKEALRLNSSAVVLCHNHPSGSLEPSRADEMITQTIKSALALVDVKVLDHIVTSHGRSISMVEKNLM